MAKQKKEKQIPYQQQIYEQMLTKQLYGDQDPASRIEANYNEWLNKKNSAAKIEENYNAWLKNRNEAKQAETQTVEAPTVDTKPVEEPIKKTTTQKKAEPKREQKKYLTHADVMPQLQKRSVDVTNYPEMAKSEQGGTVDLFNRPKVDTNELKKAGWKEAGEGTATVFSSTYTNAKGDKAGNFTPIVTDAKGNYLRTLSEDELTRYAESVLDGRRKDDLKLQIGKAQTGKKAISDAVSAAEKVHTEQEEYYLGEKRSKALEAQKNKGLVGSGIKQLDLSKYNLPSSKMDKNDYAVDKTKTKAALKEKEKTDKAFKQIQNDYIMSPKELKEAKSTAKKELKKLNKDNLTPEEQTRKDIYTSLQKKTSAFDAAKKGARKLPLRVSKLLADAGIDLYQSIAEPVAGALDDITGSGYDRRAKVREAAENDRRRVNENYQYLRSEEKEAQAQHPGAYGAGSAATQMAMYYLTNPLFDKVGKGLGLTNKAAQFAVNQVGQAAQDVALDIYPAYQEAMEDGVITEEEANELKKMGILDVGMNLTMPALQYGLGKSEQTLYNQLGKTVGNDAEILKTMDETGALREAKNAAKQIPELNPAENVSPEEIAKLNTNPLEADNKQFRELMNTYNNQFKDESAMKNIFTPEDLNASQNRQLAELMDEYKMKNNPIEPIPELEPKSVIDAVPETNVSGAVKPIVDAANTTPSSPSFELPGEAFNKLDSRFEEIARPLNMVEKSGIMNTVTDEKALKEWKAVNEAYSDYLNKAMFGESIEEAEAAKKTLDNARKRYGRAMKNIDPNISKAFNNGTFGNQIGRPLYDRNVLKAEGQTDEMLDIIKELEGDTAPATKAFENAKENFADVKPEKPISIDTKGKRPYAKNQGVSPAIENEAKRIDKWIEEQGLEQELAEANAKSVGQSMDNATRKVPGAEPLQFFGNKGNESKWETSKFRTNTAEKQGWGESMPMEHYAYRVFPEQEQRELAAQRYKNSDNVTKELLGKNYNEFDAADIKASIDEIKKYEAAGDVQSLRQADRLGQKMSTVQRENARVVQASAELNKNSFAGALSDAHTASDDIVEIWGTKNKKKLEGNSRIAKALADMGYKKPNGKAAVPLTHEEVKKGVIAELEREVGSVNEHFNENDIEYLTILAENKSIPIWQITSEIEHKLNTGNWYSLDESLPIPRPTNRKLMNALNSLVNEQVRVEKQALSLDEITEEVRNTLAKESANFEGKFSEDDVQYLANLIHEGASKDDLIKALNTKLATGKWGISDETLQEVNNIFKEISHFDEDSKPFVEGQVKAYELLAKDILPDNATPSEVFETWRYIAMLGNPKTMLRNKIGNDTFNVVTGISNNVAAIAEAGIDRAIKAGGGQGIQRTKSVLNPISDAPLIKNCAEDGDASNFRRLIGQKYEKFDENALRKAKSVFNSKILRMYEKATDAGISDYKAIKRKYATSLAGYLKANGYDVNIFKAEDELKRLKNIGEKQLLTSAENAQIEKLTKDVAELNKARDYAIRQAEYATFHEDNKIASVLSKWSKLSKEEGHGIGHILIEGMIPFKKTPANVLRSGIEYSPLGAVDSIRRTGKLIYENTGKRAGNLADVYKNSKGKEITKELAADVIDSWSKTLTGTGLTALGYYLYNKGILHLSEPDTKYQDQLEGRQNYAIEINGKSYTIDWAAPSVMPLTVGAEVARLWSTTGKDTKDFYDNINDYMTAANRLSDPMIEMSMLQGVKDTLETGANYVRNDEAMNIIPLLGYNLATGYITQGVPTVGGQIARTIDNTRRSTYTDKESVSGVIDKQIKKQMNKIPGLSMLNEPYIDTYGREQANSPSDNAAINLAYQMLSPGYLSDINETKADKISREAYSANKNKSTLPKWQSKFEDSNQKRVSPEKYTKASKAYGKAEYDIRNALANDKWFNKLDPEGKEKIVEDINDISNKVGKNSIEKSYNPDDKAYQIYKAEGSKGLVDYMHRKYINDKYDVSESDGATAVFDKYGEKGVKNYAKVKKALNKSQATEDIKNAIDRTLPTLSDNEKAIYYSYLDTDASPGTNPFGYVPGINYNVEKDKPYQRAKAVLPKLSPEKFHEERDKIDKWGDESRGASYGNKKISEKDELLPYINATAKSLEEAQQLYDAYGNQLTNKKGVKKRIIQKGGQYVSTY